MELSWFYYSIIAFVLFGTQNFLYKFSAHKNYSSRTITLWYIVSGALIIWFYIWIKGFKINFTSSLISLVVLDALAYFSSTLLRLEAFKHMPANLVYLVLRTNIIMVVLFSTLFLQENFTKSLLIGLVLMALVCFLVYSEKNNDKLISKNYKLGILLAFLAAIGSAGAFVCSKFAADFTKIIDYMALTNTLIVFISVIEMRISNKLTEVKPKIQELLLSIVLAVVNLVAWFAIIFALQTGPLNIISTITGISFIVSIALTSLVYREKISFRRLSAIFIAVIAIVILKN